MSNKPSTFAGEVEFENGLRAGVKIGAFPVITADSDIDRHVGSDIEISNDETQTVADIDGEAICHGGNAFGWAVNVVVTVDGEEFLGGSSSSSDAGRGSVEKLDGDDDEQRFTTVPVPSIYAEESLKIEIVGAAGTPTTVGYNVLTEEL